MLMTSKKASTNCIKCIKMHQISKCSINWTKNLQGVCVSSLLDGVEAAEHEPGVDEHEDVAGGEKADVQVQVGHGHVGKAEIRHIRSSRLLS